jgi:outer membrane protein assembly factor BamB
LTLALTDAVQVSEEAWAMTPDSGYNQIVFHRTSGENTGLKTLTLTVPLGEAAVEPTPFHGGLLVPLHDGRVVLSDPTTGAEQVHPFHPQLEAGMDLHWQPPGVHPEGDEFVIANNRRELYRVGISEEGEPHLEQLRLRTVSERMVGPPAPAGNVVYQTMRSATGDSLVCLELPTLKELQKWPLSGRLEWGPASVGERILLATGAELLCLDSEGQLKWKMPWDRGAVAGEPRMLEGELVLATEQGAVVAIDPQSGETVAAVEVGEPLSGGPLVYQEKLLVAGKAGVLFLVARPTP